MGGEGSGWKPTKPSIPKEQRDSFCKAVAVDSEPPKKQQCTAVASITTVASTSAPDAHQYQGQLTFKAFPVHEALKEWHAGAEVRGRYKAT